MKLTDKKDLLEKRELYLTDDIEQSNIMEIIKTINEINIFSILHKNKFKNKPIHLYINSYGGDVYSCLGLYSVIKKSKVPVYTYGVGPVMSAAFIIFLAGKKRYSYKYSTFMYHQLSGGSFGTLKDIKDDVKQFKKAQKSLDNIVVKETNIKQTKLDSIKNKKINWYINPKEASILKIAKKFNKK